VRAVRGDGNCYWRSVIFTYIENLIFMGNYQGILDLASWLINQENPYFKMDDERGLA
jgi:hypothetical protein